MNHAATSVLAIVSVPTSSQLPSKDKSRVTEFVSPSKTLEPVPLPDKDSVDQNSSTVPATEPSAIPASKNGRPTSSTTRNKDYTVAPTANDDKTSNVFKVGSDKDSGNATYLPSKDGNFDESTAVSSFQDDKTTFKDTKSPAKDDKTLDLTASSTNKIPLSLTAISKETGKSDSSTALTSEQTSSARDKGKELGSSLVKSLVRPSGTDHIILVPSPKDTDKSTRLPAKDKSLSPLELVYSVTVPVKGPTTSVPSKSVDHSFSSASSGSLKPLASKSTTVAYLSIPSLNTMSLDSVSKTEFPGYQIVPSPTQELVKEGQTSIASITPVYIPAMLGNAYGGGFIATPSVYVKKRPYPNGPSEGIPPGYGSDTKPEASTNSSFSQPSFAIGKDKSFDSGASRSTKLIKDKASTSAG